MTGKLVSNKGGFVECEGIAYRVKLRCGRNEFAADCFAALCADHFLERVARNPRLYLMLHRDAPCGGERNRSGGYIRLQKAGRGVGENGSAE